MQNILNKKALLILSILLAFINVNSQSLKDTSVNVKLKIPVKYFNYIDTKIEKYSTRITAKTEKTLTKLSKWENKIHVLIQKINPGVAARLFGNGRSTFSTLLEAIKSNKLQVEQYLVIYDEYRDKLKTSLQYLQNQKNILGNKILQPVVTSIQKLDSLSKTINDAEYIQKFIKTRKNELLDEAVKYIGKSKYLEKINKESYYYIETFKNYKELFSDTKKIEESVTRILKKLPAYQKFIHENSQLAELFPFLHDNAGILQRSVGLQSKTSIEALIYQQISTAGTNSQLQIQQTLARAHAKINEWKDKVDKLGGSSSDFEMPGFKPNIQKTKTFLQRIEFGSNVQFAKSNNYMPATTEMGIIVGYKLNEKSIIGIGAGYKMGLGTIRHLRITNQGIGLRFFVDYIIKNSMFISGGYELNYKPSFSSVTQSRVWQSSGLIGLSRKYTISKKFKGNMQLLWDFISYQHIPKSQPLVYRIGYTIK